MRFADIDVDMQDYDQNMSGEVVHCAAVCFVLLPRAVNWSCSLLASPRQ